MAEYSLSFAVRVEPETRDKLRVPDSLEEVLEDGFLNVELLVDGNDDPWYVTLLHEEADNGWKMYLNVGWSDFMDDNALNVGDVLMLKYIGDNSFLVRIIYRIGPPQGAGAGQSRGSGDSGKKRGRKPTIEGSSAKMKEANAWLDALAEACGEDFFKFTFTKEYFNQAIINIPLPFAKEHYFMGFPPTTAAVLQYDDKQFEVELKIAVKNGKIILCSLRNGVREFLDCCNVQVDEAGLFKYRKGYPRVFDVDLVLV